MVAAHTVLPVLGVPVQSAALQGLDSLLSIVQMPGGVPVGDAGHRQGRRDQRRTAGRRRFWPTRVPSCARSCARFATSRRRRSGRNGCRDRCAGRVIAPGAALGVLGSGQLGRMFTIAARRMGYRVHTFSPDEDTPTGQVADVEVSAVVRRPRRAARLRAPGRRGDLRVRERADRRHRRHRGAGAGAAVRRGAAHGAAAGAREDVSRRSRLPDGALRPRRHARRAVERRGARRHAGRRQDRRLRLRRQGPAHGHDAGRRRAHLDARSATRKPSSRSSSACRRRSRWWRRAGSTARWRSTRCSRTAIAITSST